MERTDLRDQFFAEARSDPFTNAVTHHVANAWAMGYEQALRDNGLTEGLREETHNDRFNRAVEWMTDDRRRSEAEAIIALANLGKLVGPPKL